METGVRSGSDRQSGSSCYSAVGISHCQKHQKRTSSMCSRFSHCHDYAPASVSVHNVIGVAFALLFNVQRALPLPSSCASAKLLSSATESPAAITRCVVSMLSVRAMFCECDGHLPSPSKPHRLVPWASPTANERGIYVQQALLLPSRFSTCSRGLPLPLRA